MADPRDPERSAPLEVLAWIAVAAVVGGVALAWLRAVPALVGFRVFTLGGLVALLVGVVALVRRLRGRPLGTGSTIALAAGVLFVALALRAAGAPVINDVTTAPDDPPAFRHAATLPENAGRDLGYPATFADAQRACCADLVPVRVPRPAPDALALAAEVAGAMPGWTVTATDPAAGLVEAVATTAVFGFQDDVVIRVRPDGDGSRMDVRSKSREGRGDVGANASRIRAFAAAVSSRGSGAG